MQIQIKQEWLQIHLQETLLTVLNWKWCFGWNFPEIDNIVLNSWIDSLGMSIIQWVLSQFFWGGIVTKIFFLHDNIVISNLTALL